MKRHTSRNEFYILTPTNEKISYCTINNEWSDVLNVLKWGQVSPNKGWRNLPSTTPNSPLIPEICHPISIGLCAFVGQSPHHHISQSFIFTCHANIQISHTKYHDRSCIVYDMGDSIHRWLYDEPIALFEGGTPNMDHISLVISTILIICIISSILVSNTI